MRKDIGEIDENLKVSGEICEPDLQWYDCRQAPFQLYGLYRPQEGTFKRLPDQVAAETSEGVAALYQNTAGGRLRFSTTSNYVAIRAEMPAICRFSHMPLCGTSGFDLYLEEDGKSSFVNIFRPPIDMENGYQAICYFPDNRKRSLTINFPLYNDVDNLWIGLQKDAFVGEGPAYRLQKPVLYYGSSITQGGCATRPGNSYEAILSRRFNWDYLNFGFSGNARAEAGLIRYLASLDSSVFVCDYDHNAPTVEHLEETHLQMYEIIREAKPDLPIILVSKPNFDPDSREDALRRNVIVTTYQRALVNGDQQIYFVDGQSLFQGYERDCCTVDTVHPNDLGFVRMAEALGIVLEKLINQGV